MSSQLSSPTREDDGDDGDVGELAHRPDVYSFFKFVVPLKTVQGEQQEREKPANTGMNRTMAYLLVLMAIVMQCVVLWAIFHEVVMKAISWQNGVVKIDDADWSLFSPPDKCTDGSALCTYVDGIYTCAPPSVQLTSRWAELDIDKDGMWSFEEAEKVQKDLMCKFGVDPVEVFRFFVKILDARKDLIWIHADVRGEPGGVIHEAYFQYLTADVAMCVYRTADMCPNLLQRGFFDSALKYGTSPRVGNTTTSALEYCRKLLEPGGLCEQRLPSTYWVWKSETVEQCQTADYTRFGYKHPKTGFTTSLLSVDYHAREVYAKFQTPLFMAYKSIIVFVWFLTMLDEVKYCLNVLEWARSFKSGRHEMDESMTEITQVKSVHYRASVFLMVMRSFICIVLIWVGTQFLMKSKTYVGQLFDAIAMVFVLQFSGLLHDNGIRAALKDEVGALKPMKYKRKPLTSFFEDRAASADIVWLFMLAASTALIMSYNHYSAVVPVYEALGCTCLQTGSHCHEARAFDVKFWQNYWLNTIPRVFKEIDRLKVAANSDNPREGYPPAAAPANAPAATLAHFVATPTVPRRARHHTRHRRHHEAYEQVRRLHR